MNIYNNIEFKALYSLIQLSYVSTFIQIECTDTSLIIWNVHISRSLLILVFIDQQVYMVGGLKPYPDGIPDRAKSLPLKSLISLLL